MSTMKHGTPNNPPMHLDCGMNYFPDYIAPADNVSATIKAQNARGRVKFSTRTDAQKAAVYAAPIDDERLTLYSTPAQMRAGIENTTVTAATFTKANRDPRVVSIEDGVYVSTRHCAVETEEADTSGSVGVDAGAVIGATAADAS